MVAEAEVDGSGAAADATDQRVEHAPSARERHEHEQALERVERHEQHPHVRGVRVAGRYAGGPGQAHEHGQPVVHAEVAAHVPRVDVADGGPAGVDHVRGPAEQHDVDDHDGGQRTGEEHQQGRLAAEPALVGSESGADVVGHGGHGVRGHRDERHHGRHQPADGRVDEKLLGLPAAGDAQLDGGQAQGAPTVEAHHQHPSERREKRVIGDGGAGVARGTGQPVAGHERRVRAHQRHAKRREVLARQVLHLGQGREHGQVHDQQDRRHAQAHVSERHEPDRGAAGFGLSLGHAHGHRAVVQRHVPGVGVRWPPTLGRGRVHGHHGTVERHSVVGHRQRPARLAERVVKRVGTSALAVSRLGDEQRRETADGELVGKPQVQVGRLTRDVLDEHVIAYGAVDVLVRLFAVVHDRGVSLAVGPDLVFRPFRMTRDRGVRKTRTGAGRGRRHHQRVALVRVSGVLHLPPTGGRVVLERVEHRLLGARGHADQRVAHDPRVPQDRVGRVVVACRAEPVAVRASRRPAGHWVVEHAAAVPVTAVGRLARVPHASVRPRGRTPVHHVRAALNVGEHATVPGGGVLLFHRVEVRRVGATVAELGAPVVAQTVSP